MIEDEKLREELRQKLQDLDMKADWEGGLSEMILGYGGWDYFPDSCQKPLLDLVDAYGRLQVELRRLSKECGYEAGLW